MMRSSLLPSSGTPGSPSGGRGLKKDRRQQLSIATIFVRGVCVVAVLLLCAVVSFYFWIFLNSETEYVDYGDNIYEVYPVESAKMKLSDLPAAQTGQRKEPTLREAFPHLRWPEPNVPGEVREDISRPIDTIHLRNTTQEEVNYYVTRGYVVVIDDMARGHPMLGWGCETYAEKWPNGLMRGEYPTPWRINDNEEGFTLRLKYTNVWIHTFRPAWYRKYTLPGCLRNENCSKNVDNGATAAAYVWHVKDREPLSVKQSMQQHWTAPYYMNSKKDRESADESFEMWFAPIKGGTFAHSDSYCETTASMQLKGSKTWRIMNPGPRVDTYKDRIRYEDAEIYAATRKDQQWNPELLVTVPEGGGIIFPPYAYHETLTDNKECGVSTTFNVARPMPTRYIRNFMGRLLNQHLGYKQGCHRYWNWYALWTMKDGKGVPDANGDILPEPTQEYLMKETDEFGNTRQYMVLPTTDEKLMNIRYEKILKDVDTDESGVIERSEIVKFISGAFPGFDDAQKETVCQEFLAYYDLDDTGEITKEELWDGWEHWNINSAYAVLTHKGGLWNGGSF